MYSIGYDIGSSSIKAVLIETDTGKTVASTQYPKIEMDIISKNSGWAEQHPEIWWENVCNATKEILKNSNVSPKEIKGIGIAYQMHGLVCVDKEMNVLRSSIIWCDSRAVDIGRQAYENLGSKCLEHSLNAPGNFTASKLKWVKENEPEIYQKIFKILLPGDYIAMKLTGELSTTISGLSEAILWDFKENKVADFLLDYFGLSSELLPKVVDTFGEQGYLTPDAAEACGLHPGTPVSYRAGDQPNNALALNVFSPGEIAASGGTSGVVYGVPDRNIYDKESRVNNFAHVNHSPDNPRIGVLLCINGAGILYSWIKNQLSKEVTYEDMEKIMDAIPVNSEGLSILPFGNGVERMFQNRNPEAGAYICNLQFNRHTNAHIYRATLEGIAYSFIYGIKILNEMGLKTSVIRVGNDNLFQSGIFSSTVCNLAESSIEVINTSGAAGAAKAAAYGLGEYKDLKEAFGNNEIVDRYDPGNKNCMRMVMKPGNQN